MYLKDIKETCIRGKFQDIEIGRLKLFLFLCADDIVIFADNENMSQKSLDILYDYCTSWKLKVNINKTKMIVLGEEELYHILCTFAWCGIIEIVNKFTYTLVLFYFLGVFCRCIRNSSGSGEESKFKLSKYLERFTSLSTKHALDLFDKLIKPVLHYGCESCGFKCSTSRKNAFSAL